MLGTADLDAFISSSITAIVTTLRRDGSPASSMIGYSREGDLLYFSTTADRLKGRTLERDRRVVLCIINPAHPDAYVSVEGTVTIHRDNPKELRERMYAYWERLLPEHPNIAWAAMGREQWEPLATEAGRAIYEVTCTRVSGMIP